MQEYPKWVPDPDDPEKGRVLLGPDEEPPPPEPIAQATEAKRGPGRPRKAAD